ncbi:hypothetical protein [Pseudomonas sp. NFX224]|uniref:hypothetical protein n=1 Tax=Pseudomonas sp. NFX224 TaxID=3402862 RepID=UPI003AFB78C5
MSKLSWALLMTGITAATSPAWGQKKNSQTSDATDYSDGVASSETHDRPYSQFDRYMLKGPSIRRPPVSETILRDKDEFRMEHYLGWVQPLSILKSAGRSVPIPLGAENKDLYVALFKV